MPYGLGNGSRSSFFVAIVSGRARRVHAGSDERPGAVYGLNRLHPDRTLPSPLLWEQ